MAEAEIRLLRFWQKARRASCGGVTRTVTDDMRSDNGQSSQWSRVRSRLRAEFGEAAYRSWLKPASFELVDGRTVRILAPTRFMRDWIETQYGERLKRLWLEENPELRNLEIVHIGNEPSVPAEAAAPATGAGVEATERRIREPVTTIVSSVSLACSGVASWASAAGAAAKSVAVTMAVVVYNRVSVCVFILLPL